MTTAIQRLIRTETKLFLREPLSLIFVLAFPALVVLVLAGSFDHNDPGFGGATPSDYYISAYISVVLAAMGFIMLPVHLAAYRERGVLRRFQASHLPPWALPAAWVAVAAALSTAGIVVLLTAAQLSFGVPGIDHLGATLAAVLLAVLTYISIGILLGMLLPTARAAQGVGLALFFVSFLLGGGGPPPDAMPAAMRRVADLLPMTQASQAIQHSWLSIGSAGDGRLLVLGAVCAAATGGWLYLANRTAPT